MDIREHSSKFTIFVYTPRLEEGANIKVSLAQAGYDSFYFGDKETLEHRFQETSPHILIFSTLGLEGSLNDFVEKVRGFNEDIKFVIIARQNQFEILSQYNAFGVEDIVALEGGSLDQRALWATDRICEKIYMSFQNEQLYARWEETQQLLIQSEERAKKAEGLAVVMPPPSQPAGLSLAQKLVEYRGTNSKEELIQKFMNWLEISAVYFKFLQTVGSLVATHAQGFDPNAIQGVGSYLNKDELKELSSLVSLGRAPASFATLLKNAFHFEPAQVLPLYVHGHLEGLLAYSASADRQVNAKFTEEFELFSLNYSHQFLEQKVDQLEVQDFVTGAYNRSFYLKTLRAEFDRSRRHRVPLCVAKVSVDDFFELEQVQGEVQRDGLLKALVDLFVKTGRTHDFTCRTQLNEFALILPNSSRKGATLRAERLRRIVESTPLIESGLKVSVSIGISEYPGMCHTPETLDETSTKALQHISGKGGNKICLYKAPNTHTPEFEVLVE